MKTDTIEVKSDLIETGLKSAVHPSDAYEFTKRTVDIIGSLIAFIVLAPLSLAVALFIKIVSKGPVFFKQTRLGQYGRPFEVYKFRTMKVDAEKHTGPVWAKLNDNRLIPGGSFLRKAHIDEIPQFINVLKGDMSIIGPRPERPYFVAQLKNRVRGYEKRLLIKPGITGLAQVRHRPDETIDDVRIKIKYDLFYLKKKSIFVDLYIIFQTLGVILTGGVPQEKLTSSR